MAVAADLPVAEQTADLLAESRARAALVAYGRHWSDEAWQVVSCGEILRTPIVNPATRHRSRTFQFAASLTAVVADGARRAIVLPMATREAIEPPEAAFWQRAVLEAFWHVAPALTIDPAISAVLLDVVRQPEMRPRTTSRQVADRETWPDFERRVQHDMLAEPSRYFQRRLITADAEALQRHRAELWQTAVDLRLARQHGRHYRNSAACLVRGQACEYLPLCSGHASTGDARWVDVDALSAEIGQARTEADATATLTPCRLHCFQLCRRKHFYRYELGFRDAERAAAEPRRFAALLVAGITRRWNDKGRITPAER
ncbi:MAG TPA: hypothetical protein VHZ24_22940 [Pirellulales bacterium]|jgi:hypothetical protein|nr:hypothetical protein [Pirellulales bacterium]